MKVYTKTGDKGTTSLVGGKRVPKYHKRIEAYGTIDELNSHIGLIRDQKIDEHTKAVLLEIQDRLMVCGTILATDIEECKFEIPQMKEEDILFLEKEIDLMDKEIPALKTFVLPGGHTVASFCHIARCVCRRAERVTIEVAQEVEVDELVLKYLNRLSDFLFVLSRKLLMFFKVDEIPWQPKL